MKNKIVKVILILIGIALVVFGINQIVKQEIVSVQGKSSLAKGSTSGVLGLNVEENVEANAIVNGETEDEDKKIDSAVASIPKLAKGEIDPSTYGYNIHTGTFTVTKGGNSFNYPTLGGFQIYCINPAYSLDYKWQITWAKARELLGKKYQALCGCAQEPYEHYKTPISYSEDGDFVLSPAAAYIVSDEPIGSWSEDKQRGLWNLRDSGYDGGMILNNFMSPHAGGSSFDKIAIDYANYDAKVRDKGLKPEDQTNLEQMKVLVDTDEKEYIAGPFNLKYTNGVFGNVAFAGISEMKIVGYNGSKEVVREDIKIEKFLLKDEATGLYSKELTPDYFTPDSVLKVDKTAQVYPASGQDFKVVFKDPNEGITDAASQIEYISIKVKFKYMLANGMYAKLNGVKVEIQYAHDHGYNRGYHEHYCGGCTYGGTSVNEETGDSYDWYYCPSPHVPCYDCETTCTWGRYTQQWLAAADAIRSIYEQEVHLAVEEPVDITIRIAGNVWEDKKGGKENTVDGVQGESEPPVAGIPVILYSTDGTVVKTTVTDENGNYSFDRLDAMKKYYVEFKYNGQQYENTIYTNNLSGGYSNATESVKDRDAFNKKFEEIDGDEGYTLDKVNYDDGNPDYLPDSPFGISAYTGSDGKDKLQTYPKYNKFIIGKQDETFNGVKYEAIYEKGDDQKEVDFGIVRRIQFDMAAKKDVYVATVEVNGKTEVYGYDKKNLGNEDGTSGDTWNIQVVGGYDRGLSDDDYGFTGQNGNNQLLEVYVTYKIAVRNQSQTMLGHVTRLYDYYDSTYTYMPELSWTSGKNYRTDTETLNKLQDAMQDKNIDDNEWGAEPKVTLNENDRLTIDVNKKQQTGETVYLYLTFKVDGKGPDLSLGVKGNQAEIGSFKTYYKEGTILPHYGENNFVVPDDNMIAGRVDKDSIPSNMKENEQLGKKPEDDEDKAPNVDVHLTGDVRKMNGTVWEDERTLTSGDAIIGDGLKQNDEKGIAGVKVQLIEKTVQGTEYMWQEGTTGSKKIRYRDSKGDWQEKDLDVEITEANIGIYNFEGYVAGDYYVRFYYGDSRDTVVTKANGGKNDVSYNGQDFKSTTYQVGVTQNETTDKDNVYKGYRNVNTQNESKTYGYDIAEAESKNVSDAKDIWSRRDIVNLYSKENVTNKIAEILASPYETPSYNGVSYTEDEMKALVSELINSTYMIAETGVIVVEVEKNMQSNLENGLPSYSLVNIDLGLTERPKAQLEIDKSIANVKVTLANGSVLFDVNKQSTDIIWKDHEEYNLASKKQNGKYEEYYGENGKHRYSYRSKVDELVEKTDKGLIQITMDEELMHGATITITYKVKVTNVGEVDYEGQKFYYLGNSSGGTKVTTKANQVVDYVANNMKFNASDAKNNGWSVIKKDSLIKPIEYESLINKNLSTELDKFNNIIQTEGLDKSLKPGESTEKELVLTQLISNENTSDDLTYKNIVEIVKTSNTVGRRMAYSVVGNQDPEDSIAAEVDSSIAERVIILPPFGNTHIFYILFVSVGIILVGGIALIIKKVLKK